MKEQFIYLASTIGVSLFVASIIIVCSIAADIKVIKNTVNQQTHERNYFFGLRAVDTIWNPDCSTECYVHFVKK